jgi:hypothetical protein
MEDLVGIKVQDKILGTVGFITWGRVFDRVDSTEMLEALKLNLSKFGIHHLESITLCDTLQEVATFPYFYEGLFAFAQEKISYGKSYDTWCAKKKNAIIYGEDVYFLGIPQKDEQKKAAGSISHGFYIKL